jgi:hypothetical protein
MLGLANPTVALPIARNTACAVGVARTKYRVVLSRVRYGWTSDAAVFTFGATRILLKSLVIVARVA